MFKNKYNFFISIGLQAHSYKIIMSSKFIFDLSYEYNNSSFNYKK